MLLQTLRDAVGPDHYHYINHPELTASPTPPHPEEGHTDMRKGTGLKGVDK